MTTSATKVTLTETQLDALELEILDLRDAYYNGTPKVPDSVYDAKESLLEQHRPQSHVFKKIGAPVPVKGAWPKVKHTIPMTSLNKAQILAELESWFKSCGYSAAAAHGIAVVVMDKMDGSSLAIRYENRKLVQAVTRGGDGIEGEDITRNVLLMQGAVKMLPPTLDGKPTPKTVNVRGEIVCKKSDFKAHFPGESNPRNTANGTAKRQSDAAKCAHLSFVAYTLLPDGSGLASKSAELKTLAAMGFETPRWAEVNSPADGETLYQSYVAKTRASLDYDIDGLVFEVNDRRARENLGELNHKPKGAVAYKFPHESKPTTLRNIRWQVGNSGRITPVAEFDTVSLAGANVVQASLHNISNIHDLCASQKQTVFHVGDQILASRRNDVIPYVEELLVPHLAGKPLNVPTECPGCKGALTRDGEYLVCRNEDCEQQAAGAIKRWTKKIDVKFVGESLIEALVEEWLIEDPADLYTLDVDAVAALEVGGSRVGASADKAIKNLNAKKTLPLHVIVGSVGIPMIGRSMAKAIVDAGFDSLSKMHKATIPQIENVPGFGIGSTKARSFVEGFQRKAGLIAKLIGNGIEVQVVSGPLLGKVFCPTGFRDGALGALIEKNGGTWTESYSRKVTYLIAADPNDSSGKITNAKKNGTPIITPDEAWDMVGGRK
jgi:DNA ligase (NAD+)